MRPRRGDRLLLKRHSQSAAFETPVDSLREGHWSGYGIDAGSKPVADLASVGHRGTTPAATLLPGLVMVYVSRLPKIGGLRSVTLLGDLIPN